jgi:hypothetical protein|tara:strand:- start:821 stop:2059 length:1239 start_codon:yes stop_codon:yes gene_type:complete
MLSISVQAANVGVIVLLVNGTIYTDCVNIDDDKTAYDAFQKTNLEMEWSDFGFGYFLNSVEGVGADYNAGKYWSFWHSNNEGTDFQAAMVGADDYIISSDDKVISLSFTAFDYAFNPITNPPFFEYQELCENNLELKKMTLYVDNDKESVDEGSTIDVKPGSELEFVLRIKNLDEDLELDDVFVEGVIAGIDDGDDLEEESDSFDIDEEYEDELSLIFEIPYDTEEETYDLTITITGEGEMPYRKILNYKVDVEKEKHELTAEVLSAEEFDCNENFLFKVKLINIGEKDEEVSLKVENEELNILKEESLEIDESDSEITYFDIRTPDDSEGTYSLLTTINYSDEIITQETSLTITCDETVNSVQNQNIQTEEVFDDIIDEELQNDKSNNLGFFALLMIGNLFLIGLIVFLLR